MNLLTVFMLATTFTVALAQDWLTALRDWVQAKVAEASIGQTQT